MRNLIFIVICLFLAACSPKVIYVKGDTTVEYRDSIVTKIDSVEVPVPFEVVKEITAVLDPLHMEITNAVADAWVDTNTNTLQGTLKSRGTINTPVPTKEEYHSRDSIQIREIPVPYEVTKYKVPNWCWWVLAWGILALLVFVLRIWNAISHGKML